MALIEHLTEGKRNAIRQAWDVLSPLPLGNRVFTRLVGVMAPYTGSMGARVVELRDGYSKVELRDRRAVRNHLSSVHAIALANLAELTANAAVAYSLPDEGRFIVAGMSIEYVKKSRGTITGECEVPVDLQFAAHEKRRVEVPVVMKNRAGEVVARAVLDTQVGPKRGVS